MQRCKRSYTPHTYGSYFRCHWRSRSNALQLQHNGENEEVDANVSSKSAPNEDPRRPSGRCNSSRAWLDWPTAKSQGKQRQAEREREKPGRGGATLPVSRGHVPSQALADTTGGRGREEMMEQDWRNTAPLKTRKLTGEKTRTKPMLVVAKMLPPEVPEERTEQDWDQQKHCPASPALGHYATPHTDHRRSFSIVLDKAQAHNRLHPSLRHPRGPLCVGDTWRSHLSCLMGSEVERGWLAGQRWAKRLSLVPTHKASGSIMNPDRRPSHPWANAACGCGPKRG